MIGIDAPPVTYSILCLKIKCKAWYFIYAVHPFLQQLLYAKSNNMEL